jgi:hypothetical protein
VRAQQHGHPTGAQLLQHLAHVAAPGRVERARRLVQEQHPWSADQGLGDAEPLLHPLGHVRDAAAEDVGEADEVEQLAPLAGSVPRAGEPLMQRQHLVRGAPGGKAEELGQVPERGRRGR